MEIGNKIKKLRYKSSITQEQLAERLGVSAQAVSKWENDVAMPDISLLPGIAEIFGVSIDDLFDLTTEQRFRRIESRLDIEDVLPQDVFLEYEEFLKEKITDERYGKRATELIAYLYWHRMEMFAKTASRYAKDAVTASPGEKGCQWILMKAAGHAAWDWNMSKHTAAVEFYQEIVEKHLEERLPYLFLLDNLIADHRADEAELYLSRLEALKDTRPVINEVYRAHIALARFDEKRADGIIEELLKKYPDDDACLFEAAQYYAKKCEYSKAIELYEESFEKDSRRPRFQDALMAIGDVYEILGEYGKAAAACERRIELLEKEWGITEGDDLKNIQDKKARLIEKAK